MNIMFYKFNSTVHLIRRYDSKILSFIVYKGHYIIQAEVWLYIFTWWSSENIGKRLIKLVITFFNLKYRYMDLWISLKY
jgi:hypothetical protein